MGGHTKHRRQVSKSSARLILEPSLDQADVCDVVSVLEVFGNITQYVCLAHGAPSRIQFGRWALI